MLDLCGIIYIIDHQYYFNLLYLIMFFSMLFNTISRVFLINKTTYKQPNKPNNTIKYNTPNNR